MNISSKLIASTQRSQSSGIHHKFCRQIGTHQIFKVGRLARSKLALGKLASSQETWTAETTQEESPTVVRHVGKKRVRVEGGAGWVHILAQPRLERELVESFGFSAERT